MRQAIVKHKYCMCLMHICIKELYKGYTVSKLNYDLNQAL